MITLSPEQQTVFNKIVPQLFILGFEDENFPQHEPHLGGLISFDNNLADPQQPKNITNPQQTQQLNGHIANTLPNTLRAIDCEGGIDWSLDNHNQPIRYGVNRLNPKHGFTATLCAQQIAALIEQGNLSLAKQACNEIADLIKSSGYNLTFAPVVDLANPASAVIAQMGRSFAATPSLVIECAQLFIDACKQQGIQTVLKHYPGHGNATGDSHLGITDITHHFNPKELAPYAALANQCGMIMSGHLIHRDIDPLPASISKTWLDKLRNEYNFKGVIIADDLQMQGLQTCIKENSCKEINAPADLLQECIIHALNAGNDMVIIGNQLQHQPDLLQFCINTVMQAVMSEKIAINRLHDAYTHICQIKPNLIEKPLKI